MKKDYMTPEFDLKRVVFTEDALIVSSTSQIDKPIPTEGNTVPDDDPFA